MSFATRQKTESDHLELHVDAAQNRRGRNHAVVSDLEIERVADGILSATSHPMWKETLDQEANNSPLARATFKDAGWYREGCCSERVHAIEYVFV